MSMQGLEIYNTKQKLVRQCYGQTELASRGQKVGEALPAGNSGGTTTKEAVPAEDWARSGLAKEWEETKPWGQENARWLREEQQFAWNDCVKVSIGGQGEKLDQVLAPGTWVEGSGALEQMRSTVGWGVPGSPRQGSR